MPSFPLSLTRREIGISLAASAASIAIDPVRAASIGRPTVADLIDRIRRRCETEGIPWAARTVDTIKAGSPALPVHGVATTFMSTLAMLKDAVRAGTNLIVTHEPTFWNHDDAVTAWQNDVLYRAKSDFIQRHKLAIFRFHDHWHQTKPEPMSAAVRDQLGWDRYLVNRTDSGFEARYRRPPTSLTKLVGELRETLPSRSIRFIGRPDLIVSTIGMGSHGLDSVVTGLTSQDALIVPEVREFDSGAYARDLVQSGAAKALILIAHERAEEGGMDRCANWLRTFIRDVPVRHLPSGEPFWSPAAVT